VFFCVDPVYRTVQIFFCVEVDHQVAFRQIYADAFNNAAIAAVETLAPTDFTPEQEKIVQARVQQVIDHFEQKLAWQLKIMHEHFGEEAYRVCVDAQGKGIRANWRKIAEDTGDDSIEALIKRQWEPLRTKGYEYTAEETADGIQFICTKCPAYDVAKRLGITEEAFFMWCENDIAVAEGFNPNIGFKRTKTLMQGHDCCNHFYFYKTKIGS